MPLVILHHLLNVSVQLANKRGLKKKKKKYRKPKMAESLKTKQKPIYTTIV
jgi:hypothetical protein